MNKKIKLLVIATLVTISTVSFVGCNKSKTVVLTDNAKVEGVKINASKVNVNSKDLKLGSTEGVIRFLDDDNVLVEKKSNEGIIYWKKNVVTGETKKLPMDKGTVIGKKYDNSMGSKILYIKNGVLNIYNDNDGSSTEIVNFADKNINSYPYEDDLALAPRINQVKGTDKYIYISTPYDVNKDEYTIINLETKEVYKSKPTEFMVERKNVGTMSFDKVTNKLFFGCGEELFEVKLNEGENTFDRILYYRHNSSNKQAVSFDNGYINKDGYYVNIFNGNCQGGINMLNLKTKILEKKELSNKPDNICIRAHNEQSGYAIVSDRVGVLFSETIQPNLYFLDLNDNMNILFKFPKEDNLDDYDYDNICFNPSGNRAVIGIRKVTSRSNSSIRQSKFKDYLYEIK